MMWGRTSKKTKNIAKPYCEGTGDGKTTAQGRPKDGWVKGKGKKTKNKLLGRSGGLKR